MIKNCYNFIILSSMKFDQDHWDSIIRIEKETIILTIALS